MKLDLLTVLNVGASYLIRFNVSIYLCPNTYIVDFNYTHMCLLLFFARAWITVLYCAWRH